MCQLRPGPRCAPDTRRAAHDALDTYREAYPNGPAVDPLAAAVGQAQGTDEHGHPLYGRVLRQRGHELMQAAETARTPAARAAAMAAIEAHNEDVARFESTLLEANRDMAAFTADERCDDWTRQECLAQIARNRLDLQQLTLAA